MDHLALGSLIVDRLRDKLTTVSNISASIELDGFSESSFITPAIHVYYGGEDLGYNAGQGIAFEVKQTWVVMIVVKNLSQPLVRMAAIGNIVTDVLEALQGWKANNNYSNMYRENSPVPQSSTGGISFFPLHFSSKFLTIGN